MKRSTRKRETIRWNELRTRLKGKPGYTAGLKGLKRAKKYSMTRFRGLRIPVIPGVTYIRLVGFIKPVKIGQEIFDDDESKIGSENACL